MLLVIVGARLCYAFLMNNQNNKPNVNKQNVSEWKNPDLNSLAYYNLEAFETTLPVLYIDTKDQRITKENKIWANMAVLEKNQDGSSQSILEQPDYQVAITINYRGASSYSQFDKGQYRIKCYQSERDKKDKEINFLGMGKHSEWVLHGPFLDKTLLRNHLVYSLGREILDWAPDSQYVELFLDGEYQGVYLVVEPVTNGESRLRLSKFGMLNGATPYIVKRDRVGTEDIILNTYGKLHGKTNNDFFLEYPSTANVTDTELAWIEQDISKCEEVIYSDFFDHPSIGYAKYIDVDNFVDVYLMNEIAMNVDAGNLSTYIYKELGGKLQTTLWDYNNCFDNYQWFRVDYTRFQVSENEWFHRLLQDRNFVDRVVSRYKSLRQSTFSDDNLKEHINTYITELGNSIDRNFAVWGYTFYTNLLTGEGRDITSYVEAITQLETTIKKRLNYMDLHIEDLYSMCIN